MKKSKVGEKLFIILIAIVAFISISMYSGISGDIRMKIYYEEYPSNANVTQLVLDVGEGYTPDHVITARIFDVTELKIKRDYANNIQHLRIDFTDVQGKIKIKKIQIMKNSVLLKTIVDSELNELFFPMHDVTFGGEAFEVLEVESTSHDGYAAFNDEFVKELNQIFYVQLQEKCVIFFVALFVVVFAWNRIRCTEFIKRLCEKLDQLLDRLSKTQKILVVLCFFCVGVFWCYKEYICGKAVFVFSNVACDSYNQTYPNLYHFADMISKGENIFGWDFTEGLGAVKSFLSVGIWDWGILFGTETLPYLMGISQIMKVLMAYVIMYFYLKILGRRELSAHIGAMSYALCGYMMVRQFWKSYPNIVVLTALVLFCMELFIGKKNRKWLPIALFVYCTNLDAYSVCLMFAMLVGYLLFRYFQMSDAYRIKEIAYLLLQTIGAYGIGIFTSAVCVIPSLISRIRGDRFKTGGASLGEYLFSIADSDLLKTAFFRTISSDWCGYDANFVGWGQIISAPTFYCGILMLVLIPVALTKQKRGQKISAVIAILACFIYVIFPGFNFMLNGFAEVGFRLSSIWVYYIMIYFGTLGLDFWLTEDSNKICILSSILLMILTSILCIGTEFFKKDVYIRTMIILFLFVFLINLSKGCSKNFVSVLMILLVSFDLFSNSYIFCDTPMKLTKTNLNAYKDDIIEQIKEEDSDIFYRIEKEPKIFYCDSLYQNFYGTNQYSGYINEYLHRFFSKMEIPRNFEYSKHVLSGLHNINSLYSLLSVKYVVTTGEIANDYGLKEYGRVDDKVIYINNNVLPIGFCYDNAILETEFEQMCVKEKRKVILDSCVLDQMNNISNICIRNCEDYIEDIHGKTISYVYDEENKTILFDAVDETEVVVFDFVTEGIDEDYCYIKFGNETGEIGRTLISSTNGDKRQHLEFSGNELSYVLLESSTIEKLKDIKVSVYSKDEFYKQLNDYIVRLNEHAIQDVSIFKNRIEGNVKNDKDSILFLSIPYDVGWNVYVDGEKVDLITVNYGFIGAVLSAGEHDIILRYKMPYMSVSIIMSVIGVILMTVWVIYWYKREREERD